MDPLALAGDKQATAQRPSEQFATDEAIRVIPKGATITDTTCKSIDVGASQQPLSPHHHLQPLS
ncbi:hypothetical protein [Synechococcus sp. MU1642]|uniref:hypothetical protein n=1 Tax=Synechococcus sp. MU1642 TaxID=2508348 RepID=UPI001CF89449|nr:hypothetical protein [Synechococcus sp. MU1642]